ncbi:MAG TPA: glucose-1-phosphate adenylyltransferase [Candidatus Latescibacteria bacterium]|nr:glucose-1-phosphate adenylyltransferase [Candidatus Handelsmanbacteria bacterium]HIL10495.1 glucose-1-phosphate adenylyltransferase [Candidatus Latescibacterota bacterium]
MRDVVGLILGGGQGSRLFPLTQFRSKPAVPIGGKYRLIDIPISNCIHSGINRIFVLTQFNSASLHRHISTTYRFDSFSDGFVEIMAAEQTQDSADWYQGTADAVRQQLRHLLSRKSDQVLILSGDHLYRMDYRAFIEEHRDRGADVSIAVKPVSRQEAPSLGILKIDDQGQIVDFCEKPQSDAELDELRLDEAPGENPNELYMASMGIYIFEPQVLVSLLMGSDQDDFGKHIIPDAIHKVGVYAHTFDGYWEDIGTIRSFYEANLALTDSAPPFNFYHSGAPIYTHARFLAGTRLENCRIERGIVCEGSYIRYAQIERSVIGIRSVIGAGCQIANSIVMGADFDETTADLARNAAQGIPNVGIGANTTIDGAIIDKNARIGDQVSITNSAGVKEAEGANYYIRDGIVVVAKDAVIPSGTVI